MLSLPKRSGWELHPLKVQLNGGVWWRSKGSPPTQPIGKWKGKVVPKTPQDQVSGPSVKEKGLSFQHTMLATQDSILVMAVFRSREFRPLKFPITKYRRSVGALSRNDVSLNCTIWGQLTAYCPSWWHLGHASIGLFKLGQAFTHWLCWSHLKQDPAGLWVSKDKESRKILGLNTSFCQHMEFCLISSLFLPW